MGKATTKFWSRRSKQKWEGGCFLVCVFYLHADWNSDVMVGAPETVVDYEVILENEAMHSRTEGGREGPDAREQPH